MILDLAHDQLPKQSGLKAVRLQQLGQNNFHVPPTCLVLDPLSYETAELQRVVETFGCAKHYAVRSCYRHEDGKHSFAGVFESCVDVDINDLHEAMQYVVASVESDRARAYAAAHQLSLESEFMAIIIQPMIVANEYGVCFTTAPHDSEKILIATSPRPDGVTAGDESVSERTISRFLAKQSFTGSIEHTCLAAEALFGVPQDIEFTVVDNTVYILQTRPLI